MSIDEVSLRKGHQGFVTVVSDVDTGDLLEVINSHKQEDIIETLREVDIEVREAVKEVSIDMWGGYAQVIREIFPNAKIVYDRFHVMKQVNSELNRVRRAAGITTKGSRGLLLSNGRDLDENGKKKLAEILRQSPSLGMAYELKEELWRIYEERTTMKEGRRKIEKWLNQGKILYCKAAQTIESHLTGICNYFISRTTSGVMEGINNRIKLIKRQAYGFTNFDNFRLRLLAAFSD